MKNESKNESIKIEMEDLSFEFGSKKIFLDFSLSLGNDDMPAVILGPSGCGKTTLLRLMAGLLPCSKGRISISGGSVSFIFQESRLLPWFTVLENVSIPLYKIFGKNESRERALHFLKLVSMENEAANYPDKLSGGQRQRASVARAFAYPSELLLMDEPFQSLDIPLRIEMMEICLSLLEKEKRLALLVTHDPGEAVFMGKRIMVLGQPPKGLVFDEKINLAKEDRGFGAAAAGEIEKRLIDKLLFESRAGDLC